MATSLTNTQGIIAIAAAAVAIVALLVCLALTIGMRRLRRAQQVVLGEYGQRDLVAHTAAMQEAFESLQGYVEDVAARLDGRLAGADTHQLLRDKIDGIPQIDAVSSFPARPSTQWRSHGVNASRLENAIIVYR